MIRLLVDGPEHAAQRLVLAHGAGAGMQSPFMAGFAQVLGERGVRVVRFEFPYMERRQAGTRSPPDRAPILLERFRGVLAQLGEPGAWFIGGKSMGGRMASMLADEMCVAGVVCLGYPFHPPRRPERTRTAHLAQLRTRCLIVQGTRDPFGSAADVAGYVLSPSIRMVWIDEADHSLMLGRRHADKADSARPSALEATLGFMREAP
jgi:predicted alpha/beta-hydrolase family hydrolase